jgi:hypothetical protein
MSIKWRTKAFHEKKIFHQRLVASRPHQPTLWKKSSTNVLWLHAPVSPRSGTDSRRTPDSHATTGPYSTSRRCRLGGEEKEMKKEENRKEERGEKKRDKEKEERGKKKREHKTVNIRK